MRTLLRRMRLVAVGGAIGLTLAIGMKLVLPEQLETAGCIIASITATALAAAIYRRRAQTQDQGETREAGFRTEELPHQDDRQLEIGALIGKELPLQDDSAAEAGILVGGRR